MIRREDHAGDPIGMIFLLEPAGTNADATIERLRDYLGRKVKIKKAELSREEATVEIEWRGWQQEGARLAAAARELHRKGARRNALSMYREALEIDPANIEAMLGMGLALSELDRFEEALTTLKLAREFGGKGTELILALGRCSEQLGRIAAATSYFEQALKAEPRNFTARRALRALAARG